MGAIRDGKLLYHLTALDNLPGIMARGLLPRAAVNGFLDVADHAILEKRQSKGLQNYVPFHWFSRNPFDGAVQKAGGDREYVLITVRRAVAREANWKVVPRHPLATADHELLEYDEGVDAIDWSEMERREYADSNCKSVCMAECLSPVAVPPDMFFRIYVRAAEALEIASRSVSRDLLEVNPNMFARRC